MARSSTRSSSKAQTDLIERAAGAGFNLRRVDGSGVGIALDETVTREDLLALAALLGAEPAGAVANVPVTLLRNTPFLQQAVFSQHHAEHEMLRYLKRLEDKDIALNRSMIPLGSCTMKLNATAEMIPITLPGFADIHPFAPPDQTEGYQHPDPPAGILAVQRHRLRGGFAAAERRIPGRIRRPAGDPRLARSRAARRIATCA